MTPHPLILSRIANTVRSLCQFPDGTLLPDATLPRAVYPGSFNPLHRGHRDLAEVATRRLGVEVHFELSIANADKPELSPEEVARRLAQFVSVAPIWVTRAAAFEKKADLFPGAVFVLGFDTAVRVIDPRYYGNEARNRDAALRKLRDRGCRILVGGRVDSQGIFRTWDGAGLPGELADLFEVVPESEFRADVSSTELRAKRG